MIDLAAHPQFLFRYLAEIVEWHDGDTCYMHWRISPTLEIHGQHVRVEGINAPELHSAGGAIARDYARGLAPPGTVVTLTATRAEKYGRLLAAITLPDGRDFAKLMVDAGHAAPFMV